MESGCSSAPSPPISRWAIWNKSAIIRFTARYDGLQDPKASIAWSIPVGPLDLCGHGDPGNYVFSRMVLENSLKCPRRPFRRNTLVFRALGDYDRRAAAGERPAIATRRFGAFSRLQRHLRRLPNSPSRLSRRHCLVSRKSIAVGTFLLGWSVFDFGALYWAVRHYFPRLAYSPATSTAR